MRQRRPTRCAGRSGPTGVRALAYRPPMTTTVELIHAGYIRDDGHVGSSISLIRDGDAIVVADPGLVASHARILAPLADRGIAPGDVTHVFLSHHHPDHTMNVALFPNATVVDFWAQYQADLWLDHDGDGWEMTEHTELWLTPGHSEEDASLIVRADDGVYALTHLWWRPDRTPEIDPVAPDQAVLEAQRARVLTAVDVVIPGHGEAFRVQR